jgi:carboxyl-terminal processing protease
MKRILPYAALGVLQAFFLVAAFLLGVLVYGRTADGSPPVIPGLSPGSSYPILAEIRGLLAAHFIGSLPDDKTLEYGAARGMVAALNDPYTVFVEPQAHELETQSLQGEYGGIGVGLARNEAGELVLSPYLDSPAARAGVQDGDVLVAVDATLLDSAATLDQVTALVRGPIGTTVKLTLRRGSVEVVISVNRDRIELPSVTWRIVEGHPSIGLIDIDRFSDKTPGELARALEDLEAKGATSFVLDLRDDGGGILESAVKVAAYFLDGGVVMYETQRGGPEKTYTAPDLAGAVPDAPLAVLVNRNTASAAEIVAGALLDRGRAPLIGQNTYGKGSVQLVYDLPDGSSLHVTAYRWFTPSRRELEKTGLPPTHPVEASTDGGDAELDFAIELLSMP